MSDAQQAGSTGGSNPIGTSSAVAVIADVLTEHYPAFDDRGHINGTVPGNGAWDCWCGLVIDTTQAECVAHVAEMVDAALGGLTREAINRPEFRDTGEMVPNKMVVGPDLIPARRLHFVPSVRWVSGWTPEERSEE